LKGDKGGKGDTGPQGLQGIQGLKGDKGDPGNCPHQSQLIDGAHMVPVLLPNGVPAVGVLHNISHFFN
jgi:hypothetical protein